MDISYYKKYEPIFGSWKIVREIGEGSFGKVFEIEREDFGYTYKSALKAITIPQSESELESILDAGMDIGSAATYCQGIVKELNEEFRLMSKLKGNSNVVSYEDHVVNEHTDGIGWDILIRMELLTPLMRYTRNNPLNRDGVIQMGIDICKALELCRKYDIVHRDIKPDNIFVSDDGRFKLGDFGIAKTMEHTTGSIGKKGTYNYMAPEVYKGEPYGSRVDIYSLGIMLYRYMNGGRLPFHPLAPTPLKSSDNERAISRRISGEPMPAPINADAELAKVILKACAYRPEDRFMSPTEMREALEAVASLNAKAVIQAQKAEAAEDKTVGIFNNRVPAAVKDKTVGIFSSDPKQQDVKAPVPQKISDEVNPTEAVMMPPVSAMYPRPVTAINQPVMPSPKPVTTSEVKEQQTPKKKKRKKLAIVTASVLLAGILALAAFNLGLFGNLTGDADEIVLEKGVITGAQYVNGILQEEPVTVEIDSNGRVVAADVSGIKTTFLYNSDGLISHINKEGYIKHIDSETNEEYSNPYMGTAEFTYEGGRLTEKCIKDVYDRVDCAIVYYIFYKYDSDGYLIHTSHHYTACPYEENYEYDDSGKLVKSYQSIGESEQYYLAYTYSYDSEGRLIKETYYLSSEPDHVIEYSYDAEGRLAEIVDRNFYLGTTNDKVFEYNSDGLLIAVEESTMPGGDVVRTEFGSGITMEIYDMLNLWIN